MNKNVNYGNWVPEKMLALCYVAAAVLGIAACDRTGAASCHSDMDPGHSCRDLPGLWHLHAHLS